MKVFLAFILGALVAGGVIWVMSDPEARRDARELGDEIGKEMGEAKREVQDAVDDIDTEAMKENIKETGRQVADTTKEMFTDAAITASVKSKLAADADVSALSIDVDTTDGLVTLSGKVDSQEDVKRAVEIAGSVKGVKQVISTLQVKAEPEPPPSTDS